MWAAAVLETHGETWWGDKTFGAGSIQKAIDLPDGSALILIGGKVLHAQRQGYSGRSCHSDVLVADEEKPGCQMRIKKAPRREPKKQHSSRTTVTESHSDSQESARYRTFSGVIARASGRAFFVRLEYYAGSGEHTLLF